MHFNSGDLEQGNADKGLTGATGSGEGSWRLALTSPLDIEVLSYLRTLGGGKVNADLIGRNWADILRVAATMAAGTMRPSQTLRKLASYPRQNELASAPREVARVERSLFMIDWATDPDMRRRAQSGLNKGESHHALKRAINFHPHGELRARTEEGQHYRIAGINLLAASIIYWNTLKLGEAVLARNKASLEIPVEFLTHVSPPGWEHICVPFRKPR